MFNRSYLIFEENNNIKESSELISQKIEEFRKNGGFIDQIESGVSGVESMATAQPKFFKNKNKKMKKDK